MDWGFGFVLGLCMIAFAGAFVYYKWENLYYRRPNLFRTDVGLEIDDKTVYFPHIVSVTQEYIYSRALVFVGAFLGFLSYMLFFLFIDFAGKGMEQNMLLSVALSLGGAFAGYFTTLKQRTVVRDNAGRTHILHLKDLESIEFRQELTKDIWEFYKKFGKI